jgi:hypothetical protein
VCGLQFNLKHSSDKTLKNYKMPKCDVILKNDNRRISSNTFFTGETINGIVRFENKSPEKFNYISIKFCGFANVSKKFMRLKKKLLFYHSHFAVFMEFI